MTRTSWALPLVLLTGLGLLFFGNLVTHPTQVLYSPSSDLIALHVAPAQFLAASWRATGAVPLWCPYSFSGTPFAHDVQVAAFYPMNFALYLLPPRCVPVELSWLIVVHVILAGWFMYAYARSQGLENPAALVAALGYMLGGKWMVHLLVAGHLMSAGLAWLPLVLLGVDRAILRRSLTSATWAGVAFALLILGTHPQWTLYAGLFVAVWSLGPALEVAGVWHGGDSRANVARGLGRWAGFGLWTALIAIALAAVQLLPGLEAAGQATRGLTAMAARDFEETLVAVLGLVGPALSGSTKLYDWEFRSALGVLWLAAALLAPALGGRRERFQGLVCLVLVAFALGGGAAFRRVPGFHMFPMHSRMMLVAALPLAYLAGVTTQVVFSDAPVPARPEVRRLGRRFLLWSLLLAVGSYGFLAAAVGVRKLGVHPYWLTLIVTLPAAYWLLGQAAEPRQAPRPALGAAWSSLLLLELWALSAPLVAVRPASELLQTPACVQFLAEHRDEHGRVLDRTLPRDPTRTPLGASTAIRLGIEAVRGYNPLNIHRYNEYLHFISDDEMAGRPRRMVPNFAIRNKPLLDLLGVRYVVQPSDPALVEPPGEASLAHDPRWRPVFHDAHPRTFILFEGLETLPAYSVYENLEVFPRAFLVPQAAPLPARSRVLEALKTTDFRRLVLLEDFQPPLGSPTFGGGFQAATIRSYEPNRVTVSLEAHGPGYLVLTDVWFPGWTCTVDGRPAQLHRANFLFRAVAVPAAAREVVFTFAPASLRWGSLITAAAALVVLAVTLLEFLWPALRRLARLG